MKHKVAELDGALLDAAVAKCEGVVLIAKPPAIDGMFPAWSSAGQFAENYTPSACWGIAGPIIERERIELRAAGDEWAAVLAGHDGRMHTELGRTHLIAAMRAFVASKFGDEVKLP